MLKVVSYVAIMQNQTKNGAHYQFFANFLKKNVNPPLQLPAKALRKNKNMLRHYLNTTIKKILINQQPYK